VRNVPLKQTSRLLFFALYSIYTFQKYFADHLYDAVSGANDLIYSCF
jgi:hypothetical protein